MKKTPAQTAPGQRLGRIQLRAVAQLFSVLSEESRLNILQALQSGPLCVGDLVKRSGLKQANVSRQLGIMLAAGLIARRQEGNRAIYSIEMPIVFDLCNVVCTSMADQAARNAKVLASRT